MEKPGGFFTETSNHEESLVLLLIMLFGFSFVTCVAQVTLLYCAFTLQPTNRITAPTQDKAMG